MKCKIWLCTVFDSNGLEKRLAEIEQEEQDPKVFADFSKIKQLGTEKKSLTDVLNKIKLTTREIQDLKDLYALLSSENAGEGEWVDFSVEFKKAKKDVESLYEETLYSVPVDGFDTVKTVEIDEHEYKQLKVLALTTPEEIIDSFLFNLISEGVI